MKKRLLILLVTACMMAVLPLIAVKEIPFQSHTDTPKAPVISSGVFRIADTKSGKIISVEDKEFCIGAVACEMPPSFEKEALKAQCIACYTHFCRLREQNGKESDFSANLSEGEVYMNREQLKNKWGSLYEESFKAVETAVNEVFGKVLTDSTDGTLIDAAYHAISSGQTENAKDIFGTEDRHLQAVSSAGDVNVSGYLSSKEVSADRFREVMRKQGISLSGEADTWLNNLQKTPSGAVLSVQVGGQSLTGPQMRTLFDLRSAAFDSLFDGKKFIFTVYGYGHGVGMSQYGAQCMAKQGASCTEILQHYYSHCNITER